MSTKNREAFDTIDSGILCLCLDDTEFDESNPTVAIKNFLYAEGYNRWFDKSLSLIVGKDGTAGVNFEHSWGDGVAVLRYFHDIYDETTKGKCYLNPHDVKHSPDDEMISEVILDFDEYTTKSLNEANANHKNVVDSLDMNLYQDNSINRKFCKTYKISPDSLMQLGFQLAFYKQNLKFVGTYESCSTAAFRHGRTETMRPCTEATKKFCINIEKPTQQRPSRNELRAMINECSKYHSILTRNGAMGQGFDRHLFGLKYICEKNNIEVPKLYKDELFHRLNHSILSTSTLSSHALLAGGFGPVVSDGYGIGYNIQENMAGTLITNYKNNRNGSDFVQCLEQSYEDIRKIIEG